MAAVISEVVTDAARLYHDSHSIMGGHTQNVSAESQSQHSYNRLNTPQAQHHRTVPASPRPQPTSIPQGTPPRTVLQKATGENTPSQTSSTSAIRPSVQRAATHAADSSKQYNQQHVGILQRPDETIQTVYEEPRRHGQRNDSAFAENISRTTSTPQIPVSPLSPQDARRKRNTIEVKSLDHIQSFASEEFLAKSRRSSRRTGTGYDDGGGVMKYDISDMPVADIIEMVAGLLTKITTTNDRQHETLHRNIHPPSNSANPSSPTTEREQGMSSMTSSVLAFHGKNVPPITILSYLSRIHKYCPTTYDVFLSLLVYFDRMTERVNAEPLAELKCRAEEAAQRAAAAQQQSMRNRRDTEMEMDSDDDAVEEEEELRELQGDSEEEDDEDIADSEPSTPSERERRESESGKSGGGGADLNHFFVVDGFNIHRLVIAGVTCASKFFSDVFYTNSRYAKVGGLPLNELNHLELQFLLLNDFRLSVPVEELEAYGTMLVEFYAREVIEQRKMEREDGGFGGGGDGHGGGEGRGDVVMAED